MNQLQSRTRVLGWGTKEKALQAAPNGKQVYLALHYSTQGQSSFSFINFFVCFNSWNQLMQTQNNWKKMLEMCPPRAEA